jgi:hypothetical protein
VYLVGDMLIECNMLCVRVGCFEKMKCLQEDIFETIAIIFFHFFHIRPTRYHGIFLKQNVCQFLMLDNTIGVETKRPLTYFGNSEHYPPQEKLPLLNGGTSTSEKSLWVVQG